MLAGWLKATVRLPPLPYRYCNLGTCSVSFSWCAPFSHAFSTLQRSLQSPLFFPSPCSEIYTCFKICSAFFPILIHSYSSCPNSLFPSPSLYCSFSKSSSLSQSIHPCKPMNLSEVIEVLEQLAPLSLAEPWDNVGLLVEPSKARVVKTVLLTNDLTTPVMEEAEAMSCDLIVSYHPPLFRPIKRLVLRDWKQQLAVRAIEAGMAVYSPHTALDSVRGGVNDWLIGGVGSGTVSVLSQAVSSAPQSYKLEFTGRNYEELKIILDELGQIGVTLQHTSVRPDSEAYNASVTCPDSMLTLAIQTLSRYAISKESLTILQVNKPPLPGCGQGRRSTLDEPISIATAVQRIKSHLGLSHVRLALGAQHTLDTAVTTVAVCAGSGGSVLKSVKANLYITGEMSHHEVLDAVAAGTSVILTDHSNSERGFLSVLKERLSVRLPESISVMLSQRDRDPLEIL